MPYGSPLSGLVDGPTFGPICTSVDKLAQICTYLRRFGQTCPTFGQSCPKFGQSCTNLHILAQIWTVLSEVCTYLPNIWTRFGQDAYTRGKTRAARGSYPLLTNNLSELRCCCAAPPAQQQHLSSINYNLSIVLGLARRLGARVPNSHLLIIRLVNSPYGRDSYNLGGVSFSLRSQLTPVNLVCACYTDELSTGVTES